MKFNDRVRGEIIGAVKIGVSHERAAIAADVTPRQLYRWLRRGEDDAAEGKNNAYTRFLRDFRKAESDSVGQLETNVWQQSQEDWRAAAWMLSKRARREYGDKDPDERDELKREIVEEMFSFLHHRMRPETFRETCDLLTEFAGAEPDPKALPVPE